MNKKIVHDALVLFAFTVVHSNNKLEPFLDNYLISSSVIYYTASILSFDIAALLQSIPVALVNDFSLDNLSIPSLIYSGFKFLQHYTNIIKAVLPFLSYIQSSSFNTSNKSILQYAAAVIKAV